MDAKLVCVGLTTLDVSQVVEAVPGPDQKVVAERLSVTFGGPAANAAATAVALGVPARLVTALGSGPVADLIRAELHGAEVEVVDLAAGTDARPPVSTVLITRATGQRAVASVNATGMPQLSPPDLGVLEGASAVLVDGHHRDAAVSLAEGARGRDIPVVLDGGSWKPGLEALLAQVDHAVLSADFALPHDAVGGDALAWMLDRWPLRSVARSAGAGPVELRERGRSVAWLPVQEAATVVDTLGAGDVLHGALAAELARGRGIAEALRVGTEIATRSVGFAGARGWIDG
ncbi:PfkB family carbohydrate kinase [Cellulomonas sp. NPDC089187]|uniref:PfkB family carbohydrate kinase n=1 Tax=Cellulomonas sp. NPDC089187 TaxID=3154970 RepID=UPI00342515A4